MASKGKDSGVKNGKKNSAESNKSKEESKPKGKTAVASKPNTGDEEYHEPAFIISADTFKEAKQFFSEVVVEFRKISWPDRAQVIRETWSVLVLVTVITLLVLGFDWVLGNAVFGPLEHFARLHGAGVGTQQ
jgi:preprotein translocase SecE subunit